MRRAEGRDTICSWFRCQSRDQAAVFEQCTGAHGRIRTCGLLLRRQSLYPLSYVGWMLVAWGCGAYGTIPLRLVGEW